MAQFMLNLIFSSEESKSNLEHVVMIAYKYPITDHLGPGPLVASKLRDDTSCLVNSSSNGKTGFYFIKVIPPNDEPGPKGSSLHIFPSPSFTCLCNIFILLLIDVVFVNWDLLMMYSEQICHPALDWIQRTHCKTHVLEWMKLIIIWRLLLTIKQAKNQKQMQIIRRVDAQCEWCQSLCTYCTGYKIIPTYL